ncbi:MAG: periplasmic heavy metal sensor [Bacteroidota bacterium]
MKANKILVILVIILVALNIGTLSFFLLGDSPKHWEKRRDRRPQIERFLKERLQLTDDQLQLFSEARNKHFDESRELVSEIREYHKRLMQSEFNNDQVDSLLAKLSEVQQKLERLNYEHLKTLKSYCDEGQQNAFDSVMMTMFEFQSDPHRKRLRKRKRNK